MTCQSVPLSASSHWCRRTARYHCQCPTTTAPATGKQHSTDRTWFPCKKYFWKKMSINTFKTKAMFCSSWRKYDIIPELQLKPGVNLEVVDELKLVRYMFRSDLKTCSNTSYIIKKAYKRMWIVRRLRNLGAPTHQLLDVLGKQVLSVLFLGAPAWYGQLTIAGKTHLNRVLRCGLHIIYGRWIIQKLQPGLEQGRHFICDRPAEKYDYKICS